MNIVCKNRGEGKTTELVKRSAETGYPILYFKDYCKTKNVFIEKAKELNISIPEPIMFNNINFKRGLNINTSFIIDELELFITCILDIKIDSVSINKENVVTEIESDENFTSKMINKLHKDYATAISKNDFGTGLNILKNIELLNHIEECKQ